MLSLWNAYRYLNTLYKSYKVKTYQMLTDIMCFFQICLIVFNVYRAIMLFDVLDHDQVMISSLNEIQNGLKTHMWKK